MGRKLQRLFPTVSLIFLLLPCKSFAFSSLVHIHKSHKTRNYHYHNQNHHQHFISQSTQTFELNMAIQGAGYGVSNAESTGTAVAEAVSQAMSKLSATGGENKKPTLAFVSATVSRDIEEVRQAFVEHLPALADAATKTCIPMHGITSSAALLQAGRGGAMPGAVGCLLLCSDNDQEDFVTVFEASGDAKQAAASLKSRTVAQPQAIWMGTTPGAEEGVLAALADEFPNVPVFGGTAADDALDGSWKVWSSEESSSTGISLVGIGPNVKMGASMIGPYTPTATKVTATKTDGGRRVFEINGQPAMDWVYKEWLGDEVKEQYEKGGLVLPQTAQKPIAVQKKPKDEFVTAHCAALSGLEPEGGGETYVDFFTPIPQGATLTVMDSGNGPETGYASALVQAFDLAQSNLAGTPVQAGLLIYCGGMAIAVGDNLNLGLTSNELTAKVGTIPILGMTCFGEQACLAQSKTNVQRNLSVGMILFG